MYAIIISDCTFNTITMLHVIRLELDGVNVKLHSLAKQRGTKTLGSLFKLYSIVDHIFRLQLVSQLPCFYCQLTSVNYNRQLKIQLELNTSTTTELQPLMQPIIYCDCRHVWVPNVKNLAISTSIWSEYQNIPMKQTETNDDI